MEGNVLEVLAGMQAQMVAQQLAMNLKEALDDSGLPPESRRKLSRQFKGKAELDYDALDGAIAAEKKALKEAAAVATAEHDATVTLQPPPGIQKRTVNGRIDVFVEGQKLGNFGSPAEADAAIARVHQAKVDKDAAVKAGLEEQYVVRLKMTECKLILREKLTESELPITAQEKIFKQFEGRVFEEEDLQEAINDTWDMLSPLMGSGTVMLPHQERDIRQARATEGEFAKKCLALDGFWAGQDLPGSDGKPVRRFRSVGEAYTAFMHRPYDPQVAIRELGGLTEGAKYDSHGRVESIHAQEAINTGSWSQIMGDSITRRMLAEYAVPELNLWRQVVSEISSINDFRTQRRMRMGGYGTLPVVAEGNPYTFLPTPTDQEISFALAKRGGLESITMEAMANDDVGVIRRIPARLGRSAAQTLFRGIFDMIANNVNLAYDDDTTALFTAAHGNVSNGLVLNAAGLDTGVQTMAAQTSYNNSLELLGLRPKFLLHPSALWRTAVKLTQTERGEPFTTDNDLNPFLRFGIIPIEIPYWTNATRWILIANPADINTIEVGFFRGQETPEIFVADNESVSGSSMFEADKVTYKVRHIWGSGILDHRAFFSNYL